MIALTDLLPQEMFTFSEMLALVKSDSSFGAYVCHRRPGGSRATSDLVNRLWNVYGQMKVGALLTCGSGIKNVIDSHLLTYDASLVLISSA